jgi:xanthine dehydrogenase YagT iron-sulfur-binding subunit
MESEEVVFGSEDISRRDFIGTAVLGAAIASTSQLEAQPAQSSPGRISCTLAINGIRHDLSLDPRVTLLDLLREQLHLTGTKKGCDHGQCGACTVLVDGERINSCLALAVSHDGAKVTTIEGLAQQDRLHPMQQAFLELDAFQCGFCTSGQICSAVAMLREAQSGMPSAVTKNLTQPGSIDPSEAEVRERMSGNICRCGAYPNIVAAVRAVHAGESR